MLTAEYQDYSIELTPVFKEEFLILQLKTEAGIPTKAFAPNPNGELKQFIQYILKKGDKINILLWEGRIGNCRRYYISRIEGPDKKVYPSSGQKRYE